MRAISPPRKPSFSAVFGCLFRLGLSLSSSSSSSSSFFCSLHRLFSLRNYASRRSILPSCSHILDQRGMPSVDETPENNTLSSSLIHLVKRSIDMAPGTMRRFWRVSVLSPSDVLDILLGFGPDIDLKKVELLWGLFRWADRQGRNFRHLPRSYKIMFSLLLRFRMLEEAESLLPAMEAEEGNFPGPSTIYSDIVRGYVDARNLVKSMALYDRARFRGTVLTSSCYHALLSFLIEMEQAQSPLRVFMDMVELGVESNDLFIDVMVRILCRDKKIVEAANLLRRVTCPAKYHNPVVLDMIADGFSEKRDFEDLICFLKEWKHAPSAHVCNKVISFMCRSYGSERAWLFLQKLEDLSFKPDSTTFGISISWSCREGKLHNALVYLSELFSRNLKPDVHSYNALMSGLFKEGMWQCAKEIYTDMVEEGVSLDFLTFRVLLAGYCMERKFDEAKLILKKMASCGLVSLSSSEDALSKAFTTLGLDHLGVKVKRVNNIGIQKAEFFDSLGNGLYLDTDIDEYEKILTGILTDAVFPDLNLALLTECQKGNIDAALKLKEEMAQHGQKLSLWAYAALLKSLTTSSRVMEAFELFEGMPEFLNQLDHQTLNHLVQTLVKRGIVAKASLALDVLFRRELPVENETYAALISGFYKEQNQKKFQECWYMARANGWLPAIKDFKVFISILCKLGMLKEVLEVFEGMLENFPHSVPAICHTTLKELCITGFASVGHILVKGFIQRGLNLDQETYDYLIKGFCEEWKFTEALELLYILLHEDINPPASVWQLFIPRLFRSGEMEKVVIVKKILFSRQCEASHSVYKSLISEFCKVGNVGEASLQLLEMILRGLWPDGHMLSMILEGYSKENNSTKARVLLSVILKMNVEVCISAYRVLVHMNCLQGRFLDALSLRKVFMFKSDSQPLILYNILIFYLFHTRNSQLVKVLLDEMHDRSFILDQVSYNFLIYGYHKSGNSSKAAETLYAMMAKDMRPSKRSFKIVICYLCSQLDFNKAFKLTRTMEGWGMKYHSVVQNALVDGLLSQGKWKESELLLSHLEKNDLVPSNISYDILIKRLSGHGRISKAIELLNLMLKKGNLPSEASYCSVIDGLVIQNDYDRALNFHAEMQHKNLKMSVKTCTSLVHGLCESGRADDARSLLEVMLHSSQILPCNVICSVIDRYYTQNDLCKASDLFHKMQQNGYLLDFEIHWSLVSNLSNANSKDNGNDKHFLSHLLSQSGFPSKDSNTRSSTMAYCHGNSIAKF